MQTTTFALDLISHSIVQSALAAAARGNGRRPRPRFNLTELDGGVCGAVMT